MTPKASVATLKASVAMSTAHAATLDLGNGQNGVDHIAGVGLRLALHSHGYNELKITDSHVHVYGRSEEAKNYEKTIHNGKCNTA